MTLHEGMTVLVLGAGGQVGRAVRGLVPDHVRMTALEREELDIGDAAQLDDVLSQLRPAIVINAAAYTAVDRAESEPDAARRTNASSVRLLAKSAVKRGFRLVHLSTDFVFDGREGVPYRPDRPKNPLNVYGRTKAEGEQAILEINPARFLVVRTGWVYSAGCGNFVTTMLDSMREGKPVRVVADQVGTPTSADSLAGALWRLLGVDAAGTLHYANGGVASWYDFAAAIQEEALATGLLECAVRIEPIRTADYPTPARRPAFSVLDTSETAALIGDPPHWREELRRVLNEIANA